MHNYKKEQRRKAEEIEKNKVYTKTAFVCTTYVRRVW